MDNNGSNKIVKTCSILYILKLEPTEAVEGLRMWYDRNKGIKSDLKVFAGTTEMTKPQEKQIWRKGIRS